MLVDAWRAVWNVLAVPRNVLPASGLLVAALVACSSGPSARCADARATHRRHVDAGLALSGQAAGTANVEAAALAAVQAARRACDERLGYTPENLGLCTLQNPDPVSRSVALRAQQRAQQLLADQVVVDDASCFTPDKVASARRDLKGR